MLKGMLTENLGWKFTAIVFSTLLWFTQRAEREITTSISAPLQYHNLPKELEIASDVLDRARLEIRGPESRLYPKELADAAVVIDLAGVRAAGERTFPIEAANARLPSGVRVERSQPAQVRLRLDRRSSRQVPVQIRVGNPPPKGFEIVALDVEPDRLRITGPESRVQGVTLAETDPLDLSGVTGSDEIPVHTFVTDPMVRFESGSSVTVKVTIRRTVQPSR